VAAVTAGACLLLLAGCGTSDKPTTAEATTSGEGVAVDTGLLSFNPETARVKVGQSVAWVGGDNITHVLVQGSYQVGSDGLRTEETDDGTFELRLNRKGQRVTHTYATAGTFTYYCTVHKGMNGNVVVS
jgi:plastocyanin